jgi:hypothetical protein
MQDRAVGQQEPSGWGIMFTAVAGMLLITGGLILAAYGISALFGIAGRSTDVFFYIGPTAWGITHLLGGVLMFLAGCNIFVGKFWARAVGIAVATIFILGALISIDAYPVWAVALIVLNISIIWALVYHGTEITFD